MSILKTAYILCSPWKHITQLRKSTTNTANKSYSYVNQRISIGNKVSSDCYYFTDLENLRVGCYVLILKFMSEKRRFIFAGVVKLQQKEENFVLVFINFLNLF